MVLNKSFEGYDVYKETKDFILLYSLAQNPLDAWRDEHKDNYLLVFKNNSLVEASTDSVIVGLQYLQLAQDGYDSAVMPAQKETTAIVAH